MFIPEYHNCLAINSFTYYVNKNVCVHIFINPINLFIKYVCQTLTRFSKVIKILVVVCIHSGRRARTSRNGIKHSIIANRKIWTIWYNWANEKRDHWFFPEWNEIKMQFQLKSIKTRSSVNRVETRMPQNTVDGLCLSRHILQEPFPVHELVFAV